MEKIVYSKHPYAFNPTGYEKDIQKITYRDVIWEKNLSIERSFSF